MFDAKKLLEAVVGGGQGQSSQTSGGLGDLLGQIMGQQGQTPAARVAAGQSAPQAPTGGLGDLLGQLMGQGQQQGRTGGQSAPSGGLGDLLGQIMGQGQAPASRMAADKSAPQGPAGGGGLGDLLGKLQEQAGKGGGGLMDVLGQVLGQATAGVKEGAQKFDQATGASKRLGEATGHTPDDLVGKLKELIEQNKFAAGATAGGLGGLLLGTRTGRSATVAAAKIGALALIGGLAYKAFQNYSQGRPILGGQQLVAEPAPSGSGFEAASVSNDDAILYLRAMIAAAAADGRIDEAERGNIIGAIKQAGMEQEARRFIEAEVANPASIEELAAGARTAEVGLQVYTAARLTIDPDTEEESEFLAALADRLGIDQELAAHIDAATGVRT